MKTTTMRTMIAAAALVVAAGTASAQSYTAEIPMAFRAAGTKMAPGKYEVRTARTQATEILILHNNTDNTNLALLTPVRSDTPKQWLVAGNPTISFECGKGACTLRKMWNGSASYAYDFPAPKPAAGDLVAQRLETVTLAMVKAH